MSITTMLLALVPTFAYRSERRAAEELIELRFRVQELEERIAELERAALPVPDAQRMQALAAAGAPNCTGGGRAGYLNPYAVGGSLLGGFLGI
jgi:hypothetical protein